MLPGDTQEDNENYQVIIAAILYYSLDMKAFGMLTAATWNIVLYMR